MMMTEHRERDGPDPPSEQEEDQEDQAHEEEAAQERRRRASLRRQLERAESEGMVTESAKVSRTNLDRWPEP